MGQRSPSFEANLLYRTAQKFNFERLLADLRASIEINGETLHRLDRIDSTFTLLTCGQVQILLAFSSEPLPTRHFLGAERPPATSLTDSEVLYRLTECRVSATVLVLDREPAANGSNAAPESLKRTLCWDVTDCIYSCTEADLVFWADVDTLFAAEEFERANTYMAHQERAGESLHGEVETVPNLPCIPNQFSGEPVVTENLLAWVSSQIDVTPALPAPCEKADNTALETLMSLAMPNAVAG